MQVGYQWVMNLSWIYAIVSFYKVSLIMFDNNSTNEGEPYVPLSTIKSILSDT